MFCNQCGLEISDDSKFCTHCGSRVSRADGVAVAPPFVSSPTIAPPPSPASPASQVAQPVLDVGAPQFVLRPRFIGWMILLGLPIYVFLGFFFAFFVGGVMEAIQTFRHGFGPGSFSMRSGPPMFMPCGYFMFFGVPILAYIVTKATYAKTEYRFYKDRLEYTEGFWTVENKTIRYDRIVEITMRRGVIQKAYNLGTIYLATPATGEQVGKASSGIQVKDIESPETVYDNLQKLIGTKTRWGRLS